MFKKLFSLFLICSLAFPGFLFAQTTTTATTTTTDTITTTDTTDDISSSSTPAIVDIPLDVGTSTQLQQVAEPSQTSASPQDATTTQQTITGSVIESTFDPNQTGASSTAVIDNATTSDPVISLPTSDDIDTTSSSTPSTQTIVTPVNQTVTQVVGQTISPVAQISKKDLVPKEKYTFRLDGAPIATKDTPDWKKQKNSGNSANISAVANVVPNTTAGTLEVSGACVDPYFVVLLYKNQEDYDLNPSSYIFNKAFDCTSGAYRYSIKELPPSLPDGTYYLLIGGQGNIGSWKPTTALMPITIQKQ